MGWLAGWGVMRYEVMIDWFLGFTFWVLLFGFYFLGFTFWVYFWVGSRFLILGEGGKTVLYVCMT